MSDRILIVDDDLDSLKLIGLMLQRQGYEISVANSGSQALGKAQAEEPSLIILDIMMRDMMGTRSAGGFARNRSLSRFRLSWFTANRAGR